MSAGDTLSKKRWGGGGLLLALLLLILLIAPLWKLSKFNHPLAGAQALDLCPLLPPVPPLLGKLSAKSDSAPRIGCVYLDAQGKPALNVSVTTTRQMSSPNEAANTERMFDNWIKEVRLSYGNGSELPAQGWRHAGAWKNQGREFLIFEDKGVLVLLDSDRLDAPGLARHAALVQQSLRAEK